MATSVDNAAIASTEQDLLDKIDRLEKEIADRDQYISQVREELVSNLKLRKEYETQLNSKKDE